MSTARSGEFPLRGIAEPNAQDAASVLTIESAKRPYLASVWQGQAKFLGHALSVLVPSVFWFAPVSLPAAPKHAIAISLFMLIAWMTEALDYAVAGLIGCFLFVALRVVDFSTAFAGFSDRVTWFVVGASLFGTIVTRSGLARRLAYLLLNRMGTSYARLLLGLIVCDFLLTIIVPSTMGRIVVMAAIAIGLIEAFGMGRGSNIGRGMFIILTYTANIFDKMIIGGVPSVMGRGIIQDVGHVRVLWSTWLIAFLPCSLITILVGWYLTLSFYPPELSALPGGRRFLDSELRKMGRWSASEKRALLLILVAVALWATDFLHHLSPTLVVIGAAFIGFLPGVDLIGVEDLKKINYLILFFIGAAISMGDVLYKTHALDSLASATFSWLEPFLGNSFSAVVGLYSTGFLYHLFLGNEPSMLATSLPVLMKFATTHGYSPLMLGMVWTFASGGKIFLYQSAAVVVGYSYGYFNGRDVIRIGTWLTIVEFICLMILVPLYWPLLGIR